MDITCIDHHSQHIDMAMTRLSLILNINLEGKIYYKISSVYSHFNHIMLHRKTNGI